MARELTTDERNALESRIARAFLRREARGRLLALAERRPSGDAKGSPKARARFRARMANLEHDFDPVCARLELDRANHHRSVREAFMGRDPSSVYVMSEDPEIDGRVMSLDDALSRLREHSVYGSLVVDLAVTLAYYEQCELEALSELIVAR